MLNISVDEDGSDDEEDGQEEDGEEVDEDGDVEMEVAKPSDPNDLSAFKLDEYDEEESKGVGEFSRTIKLTVAMGAFANVKGLSFYRDNNDDPYITLKEVRT